MIINKRRKMAMELIHTAVREHPLQKGTRDPQNGGSAYTN